MTSFFRVKGRSLSGINLHFPTSGPSFPLTGLAGIVGPLFLSPGVGCYEERKPHNTFFLSESLLGAEVFKESHGS